jgi:hypothetical protein
MRPEGAKRAFVGQGVDIPPKDISVPRQKIGQLASILGVVMDFDADPTGPEAPCIRSIRYRA